MVYKHSRPRIRDLGFLSLELFIKSFTNYERSLILFSAKENGAKGTAMTVYKYMRVSTKSQSSRFGLERQKHELDKVYPEAVEVIDVISGAKKSRPGLNKLLAEVEPGDRIVCVSIDRLGRDTVDTMTLINKLREKEVYVQFLQQGIDTSKNDATTNAFIGMMSVWAQFEREFALERQEMTYETMRKDGKQIGRPGADPAKIEAAISLVNEGKSYREVSKIVGLSPAKICLAMKEHRAEQAFQK